MSESVDLLKEIINLNPKGEHRPQQEKAAEEIEEAIIGEYNVLIQSPTGSGKALEVTTPVLTSKGWVQLDDIEAGDSVYTLNGAATTVVEAHESFLSEETYEMTFDDGSAVTADAEHLWFVADSLEGALMPPHSAGERARIIRDEIAGSAIAGKELLAVEDIEFLAGVTDADIEKLRVFLNAAGVDDSSVYHVAVTGDDELGWYHASVLLEALYHVVLMDSGLVLSTKEIARDYRDGIQYFIPAAAAIDLVPASAFNSTFASLVAHNDDAWREKWAEANDGVLELSLSSRLDLLDAIFDAAGTPGSGINEAEEFRYLQASGGSGIAQLTETGTAVDEGLIVLFQEKQDALDFVFLVNSTGRVAEAQHSLEGWWVSVSEHNVRAITEVNRMPSTIVRCISVEDPSHLFLVGKRLISTHNTISYLVPLIQTGQRAVVSTATKQLSEQAINTDLPVLDAALKKIAPEKRVKSALLKGRENYFCVKKAADSSKLEDAANTLFGSTMDDNSVSLSSKEKAAEIKALLEWVQETQTGDRSEAPPVSDLIWAQYSVSSAECVGRSVCPFGSECFAEIARDKAKAADIVVTNHAVVAHDMVGEDSTVLGERDVYVFDELHELDNYLSSAWGGKLTAKMLKDVVKHIKAVPELDQNDVEEVERISKVFDERITRLDAGLLREPPKQYTTFLSNLHNIVAKVAAIVAKKMLDKGLSESKRSVFSLVSKRTSELMNTLSLLLDDSPEVVRWVEHKDDGTASLHAAPLRIGPRLQEALHERDAIMVGTSATITVAGSFDVPIHNLALQSSVAEYKTVALPSPFDYPKQAMMFIPLEGDFPEPIGAERKEHAKAVVEWTNDFVQAAGGRALFLSTTMFGARAAAEYLRKKNPKMNILLQGDAPHPQIVQQFKDDETSVLCATMGMWHGLDTPGPTNILTIIDKIPFKPVDDPLSVARQDYAKSIGRNGFMDVYVAEANVMLAQGVGRLIRAKSDKGVVVILDTRLRTKRYGSAMLESLPGMKIFPSKEVIIKSLTNLRKALEQDEK